MNKFLLIFLFPIQVFSQNNSLEAFKNYPFPTELCTAKNGAKLAWALDQQGVRNVYVAEGPSFTPRKLTNFTKDDGQEITSLSITDDGKTVLFVRGGDHGSNWDDILPINPSFTPEPNTVKIASIPFIGGELKYLSEGDEPAVSPDGKKVAFIKNGQAYLSPIDSANVAKKIFTTRGNVSDLEWNQNGKSLLFVSDRGDHSIIGIYTDANSPIQWIAPSFSIDASPRWSVDGKKIVFVRMTGKGGSPESMLLRKHRPWSIYVADVAGNTVEKLWQAPKTLRGSVPTTHGNFNLHWAAGNRIVFLSYMDGWPHLYSIPSTGGTLLLLTPGNFMCEHIKLSSDKKYLTFSANTGNEKLDLERRHAGKVSVDKSDFQIITQGTGLEWAPILTDNNNTIAFIGATALQPPLPAILNLNSNSENKIQPLGNELIANYPKDKLVIPKQVIFKAADGTTIHADLFLPDGNPTKKPAIVYVHGGPPRQMLLGWHYSDYYSNAYASNQYLASLGFVVLAVNYRLGIGYGYEFHQAEKGGINGAAEYQDIKAAGEWLKTQNFVNPNKIGIYGGSYGGYLTAMALAKDSRLFAAGVDIHGVHDWGIASNIMSAFNNKTETAPDYQQAIKTAWNSSPVSVINGWKSPVLIIHGDDDRNVRFNQSTDLINRLEKKGVPYESMVIVDDTHHWMNWQNAVKVYGAVADFFTRKLK